MIFQTVIDALRPIYFLSWCVGCVEILMFRRYLRRAHPELAAIHCPGLLRGSIHQQLKTMNWVWKRQYADTGDASLIRRADLHRKLILIVIGLMVMSIPGFVIAGQQAFSAPQNALPSAEQISGAKAVPALQRLGLEVTGQKGNPIVMRHNPHSQPWLQIGVVGLKIEPTK